MKKLIFSGLLSFLFIATSFAQYRTERTGYEGDYFSLEGALDLFKQSYSLRDFEKRINTEQNWVNNLDLNYDGRIDYIRVEHRRQGNFHAIILQALVDRYDIQDVAVIEMEVIGRRNAVLQIIGDEDLYGEEVIVEPIEGYSDSRSGSHSDYGDYVNVYYWEIVQYLLGRQYQMYASPYRWEYYPTWWSPWRQCTWNIFRPRIVVYHRHYHIVHRHRVIRVHNFYRPYRSYSFNVVVNTNKVRVRQGRQPIYRPRPEVQRENNPRTYRGRNNVVGQPRTNERVEESGQSSGISRKRAESSIDRDGLNGRTPSGSQRSTDAARQLGSSRTTISRDEPGQDPSISRKRTESSIGRDDLGSGKPSNARRSSGIEDRSGSSRSSIRRDTPSQNPSVSRNRTQSSNDRTVERSRSPRTTSPTPGNNSTRFRTTTPSAGSDRSSSGTTRSTPSRAYPPARTQPSRSTTPTPRPSVNRSSSGRTTPTARPKTNSSTPSRTYQPARTQTTRSSTPSRSMPATRSTTPSRQPSSSTRRAAPVPKQQARSGQNASKSSPSRRRGGNE